MTTPTDIHQNRTPRNAWAWLLLGLVLIIAANLRWGVGALAWIAPIPILRFFRLAPGWKPRAILAAALPLAWTLATLKIITEPVPAAAALGFGIPIGLLFVIPYLCWDLLRRQWDDVRSVLAFPALMVAAEWIQPNLTPFASWGAAAYTQLENLPLLQLASLGGLAAIGWVIYGTAAALEQAWRIDGRERKRLLTATLIAVLAAHGFGALRLATAPAPVSLARVAAVGTDATFGAGPLPSQERIRLIDDALFTRTRAAAQAGASLVVWNEAATLVEADQESAFLMRAGETAREARIHLVAAYIIPLSAKPVRYENKYAWFLPSGAMDHRYLKHEPVPGEPAVRGTEAPRLVSASFGMATGAICYDYDFPRLAREHARLGAGIIALPSSDWRGIDPIHTQMASLRAIEGGFSILRSTRMGLSAGIDPYGRLRGWLSSFESGERALLVSLPTERLDTLYSRIGDALVFLGIGCLMALGFISWKPGASTSNTP
jgi:apolipoprotein N-acyltransferase